MHPWNIVMLKYFKSQYHAHYLEKFNYQTLTKSFSNSIKIFHFVHIRGTYIIQLSNRTAKIAYLLFRSIIAFRCKSRRCCQYPSIVNQELDRWMHIRIQKPLLKWVFELQDWLEWRQVDLKSFQTGIFIPTSYVCHSLLYSQQQQAQSDVHIRETSIRRINIFL